jgi:hypothetical protein
MNNLPVKQNNEISSDNYLNQFDGIVTQAYLSELSNCAIKDALTTELPPVRWYKISEIVLEKHVFFGDKLSMLYMALHQYSRNVILVLNKPHGGTIELYLGARDFSGDKFYSGEILKNGLKGYFPGIKSDKVSTNNGILPEENYKEKHIASLSALASLRDDKKENFVQGLELLINSTKAIPQFRAYFIAENVCEGEARSMINAFSQIHTSLSPLAEFQISTSDSHTEGVSESITNGVTESITANISRTVTHSDGHSYNYTPNIVRKTWYNVFGGKPEKGDKTAVASAINSADSNAVGVGFAVGKGNSKQQQTGTNYSYTKNFSNQISIKNRLVQYYMDLIDRQINRIDNGIPFGLWSVATFFVAPSETTAIELANIYQGCIIGEESNLGSCAVNVWKNDKASKILDYLHNSTHPRFDYQGLDVSAGVTVTSKELAIHLSLPQSSVPGILVREKNSFCPNVISKQGKGGELELGNIVHVGQEYEDEKVLLDLNVLTKHMFITGTTGSGKSNTMYLLLKELYDKDKIFLVIEPAKGEYKHVFGSMEGVSVYGSNPFKTQLLRINPFEFPEAVHVFEHIDRLVEIFNACWPMYAAMPVVLKKAITDAYERCGWDLYSSKQYIQCERRLFPTIDDIVIALRDFINNSEYSADTKGDYKGSIETRLVSLSEGLTGMMLNNTVGNIPDKELFTKNTIIDLSLIGNTETKALIMGLLIMKMNEFYLSQGGEMNSELRHVTVLEEAHNLLKRTSKEQSQESSNLAGKSVEMICNSIAEMRTYGEGFIIVDQSPSQVDMAAIRNTNTKIIMSLPEAEDRQCAGKSIGLNDGQIEEIGRQKQGEAIVYQNDWEEPVQCKINKYDGAIKPYIDVEDTFKSQEDTKVLKNIMDFLYSYCNKKDIENIDKLRNEILNCHMLSATKFVLLDLLDDYTERGIVMNKLQHVKIMEAVSSCLGLVSRIKELIRKNENTIAVDEAITDMIKEKIPKGNDNLYRFCTRCSLRALAVESTKYRNFYNNWIRKKKYGICNR